MQNKVNSYLLLSVALASISIIHAATPIRDITLDTNNIYKWDFSNGDTWDPFWADDDNLYAFNCDGRGFNLNGGWNLAFNQLLPIRTSGPAVMDPANLEGSMVNPMNEYGGAGQKEADGATWKAKGQECIDGVFYAFVSRDTYGSDSHDPLLRQTAVNSSLIKSTDRGLTWSRSAAENYKNPMWPGRPFGAPFFIHYGKNGGHVVQDAADKYVYATSNDGFWNDGDKYILGRVLRGRLPALNASDWSYYTGGNGQNSANWSGQIAKATPILNLPGQCGSGPACFIPALGEYLTVAWYNPMLMPRWFEPPEMKYDFYGAPHPWGPWKFIKSFSDKILNGSHMYGPSLCAKFQERPGGDVKMLLFTSGCPFDDKATSVYKMWEIPLILKTTPSPPMTLINDSDPRIVYTGNWSYSSPRGMFDYGDDAHTSNAPGASAEFTFSGTGIDYLSEKNSDHGPVVVYLDGMLQKTVNLRADNFPRTSRVVVFSARNLKAGQHTIKIVNWSSAWAVVDAFLVVGGPTQSLNKKPATISP